jgi:hypothetical protein
MNNRSWTWLDDATVSEEEMEIRTPALNDLAARWSELHNAQEQRGFIRQAQLETGEFDEPDFESDEEMRAHELRLQTNRQLEQAAIDAIEQKMHDLGARVMRPYEHWNEDEQLVAYLERDRY